ncbi:MAG: DMT family transporter [Rhizobiaceae bacterium]
MTRKHSLDIFAILIMALLTANWGFQQVAIKWAIAEIPPVWQSGLRSIGATVLVGIWLLATRKRWVGGLLLPGMAAGLLFGLEFGLLYYALEHTDAARAALLLYTAPFVVAVGGHFLIKGEHLSQLGWLGVALAFFGTAIVLQASIGLDTNKALGDICALGGGIAWGLTSLIIRTTGLSDAEPAQTLFYQLIVSGLMLCAAGLAMEGAIAWPQESTTWLSLTYQTVVVATITLLVWFALIARYSVTKLSVFTFLTPLFGALAGVFFLNERLDHTHLISLAAIMAGIAIVNLYGHVKNYGGLAHENA